MKNNFKWLLSMIFASITFLNISIAQADSLSLVVGDSLVDKIIMELISENKLTLKRKRGSYKKLHILSDHFQRINSKNIELELELESLKERLNMSKMRDSIFTYTVSNIYFEQDPSLINIYNKLLALNEIDSTIIFGLSLINSIRLDFTNKDYYKKNSISGKLKKLKDLKIVWTKEEKEFIQDLSVKIETDLKYLDIVIAEYSNLINYKNKYGYLTLNKGDLLKLKDMFKHPIQEEFINSKIIELGFDQ